MAIQFCCTQCGQPIEVDDEHAGRTAACPYCRHLVAVPHESTYEPRAAVSARPLGPPSPPVMEATGPEQPHRVPVPPQRRRTARTFGLFALICAGLAAVLFTASMVLAASVVVPHVAGAPANTLTDSQMRQIEEELGQTPAIAVTVFGAMFFAVAGLSLGIVSLTQNARGNWPGSIAVFVSGLMLLCFCAGMVMRVMQGFEGMGAG